MVILQLLLCIRWSATQSALPLDVIELDEKSFEHQTQAATGQTTGRWWVTLTDGSPVGEQHTLLTLAFPQARAVHRQVQALHFSRGCLEAAGGGGGQDSDRSSGTYPSCG